MENHYKGKSAANASNNNNIDLTLKLGLSNAAYENKQVMSDHEDTNICPSMEPLHLPYKNYECNNNMLGGGSAVCNSNSSSMVYGANYSSMCCYSTPSRRRHHGHDGRYCRVCGANDTPLWRKGPAGPQTLCNACGLKHLRTAKRNP